MLILLSDHSMDTTPTQDQARERVRATPASPRPASSSSRTAASTWSTCRPHAPGASSCCKRMRAAALARRRPGGALPRAQPAPTAATTHTLDAGRIPAGTLAGPRTGDLVVTHKPGGAFTDPSLAAREPAAGQPRRPADARQLLRRAGGATIRPPAQPPGSARRCFDDTLPNPRRPRTSTRPHGDGPARACRAARQRRALPRRGLRPPPCPERRPARRAGPRPPP